MVKKWAINERGLKAPGTRDVTGDDPLIVCHSLDLPDAGGGRLVREWQETSLMQPGYIFYKYIINPIWC